MHDLVGSFQVLFVSLFCLATNTATNLEKVPQVKTPQTFSLSFECFALNVLLYLVAAVRRVIFFSFVFKGKQGSRF